MPDTQVCRNFTSLDNETLVAFGCAEAFGKLRKLPDKPLPEGFCLVYPRPYEVDLMLDVHTKLKRPATFEYFGEEGDPNRWSAITSRMNDYFNEIR